MNKSVMVKLRDFLVFLYIYFEVNDIQLTITFEIDWWICRPSMLPDSDFTHYHDPLNLDPFG